MFTNGGGACTYGFFRRYRPSYISRRHGADEDAAIPTREGDGRIDVVREGGDLVVDAGPLGVFEQLDRPAFLELGIALLVVLRKLRDIHSAIFIEIDRHGGPNRRLGR